MDENISVWCFVAENWAQFSFVLLGIGYIAKVVIEASFKKKEIKYSIFYQQQIDLIKDCLHSYYHSKYLFHEIPYQRILKNGFSPEEVDGMIQPVLKKLITVSESLLLFYGKGLYGKFLHICENMQSVNDKLIDLCLDDNLNSIKKGNSFISYRDKIISENDKKIEEFIYLAQKSLKISPKPINNTLNKSSDLEKAIGGT